MLSVTNMPFMLSVVMLSVVAAFKAFHNRNKFCTTERLIVSHFHPSLKFPVKISENTY
jgi:hypothetical protein